MIASSVQGFGAANAGMPHINGSSIKLIPKRDHGKVEHGIVEHCTDSAGDCQLATMKTSDNFVAWGYTALWRRPAGLLSDETAAGPRKNAWPCATKTGRCRAVAARGQNFRPQRWTKIN